MLVDHFRGEAADPLVLRVLEPHGGDDLEVGVARLDRGVELREPLIVRAGLIEEVLVAHFDIGQLEGRGVARLGAERSPLRRRRTRHVFDFVDAGVGFSFRGR